MAARITSQIRRTILWLTDVRTKRFWFLCVVFGPVGYVLSLGPANWLLLHGYIDRDSYVHEFLKIVYEPISWLWTNSETFGEIMTWYARFWLPHA